MYMVNNEINKTFTNENYSSNDGFLTTVWGPAVWHSLHTISFNYPTKPSLENKKHYMNFILSLKYVLPCGKCRENLKKNLKKLPLKMGDMKSRETFSRYIYNLHELINEMLNKKSNLSYDDIRERYENFRARCNTPTKNNTKHNKKKHNKTKKRNSNEKGCVEPLVGEKSKCIIKIVPQKIKGETFEMDKRCIKKREDKET